MIKVYAVVLIVGMAALIAWVIARSLVVNVPAWSPIDPEERLGGGGRMGVAAAVGFGMAGMSSSFAAWPTGLTVAAAVAGGAAAAWYARWASAEPGRGDGQGPEA